MTLVSESFHAQSDAGVDGKSQPSGSVCCWSGGRLKISFVRQVFLSPPLGVPSAGLLLENWLDNFWMTCPNDYQQSAWICLFDSVHSCSVCQDFVGDGVWPEELESVS